MRGTVLVMLSLPLGCTLRTPGHDPGFVSRSIVDLDDSERVARIVAERQLFRGALVDRFDQVARRESQCDSIVLCVTRHWQNVADHALGTVAHHGGDLALADVDLHG